MGRRRGTAKTTPARKAPADAAPRFVAGDRVEIVDGLSAGASGVVVGPAGWDWAPGVAQLVVMSGGERRVIREDFLRRVL